MPRIETTEHVLKSSRHTTFYLKSGPADGPLIIFVHGWPELSLSWRHQLPHFAAMGFTAVAPDMRGYGRSSVYQETNDYCQAEIVQDMLELLDHLGREQAIWIGHDWGSPVVWNIASHHPHRCHGVVSLCVPYRTVEFGLEQLIELVDRELYPQAEYPAGQWEYMRFYEENFEAATAPMDANPYNMVKAMFRKGSPEGFGKPSGTAMVRRNGGWFGAEGAPDVPRDADVVTEQECRAYASALAGNGFSGPNAWYMNHRANAEYNKSLANDGYLDMPVLFMAARYDYTCESVTSRLAEPMREYCRSLRETIVDSGHWMAQEKPFAVNGILAHWIAAELGELWPFKGT